MTGGSPSVPSSRSRMVTTVPVSMPSHSAASGGHSAWVTVVSPAGRRPWRARVWYQPSEVAMSVDSRRGTVCSRTNTPRPW